jgi:hypothetical protein
MNSDTPPVIDGARLRILYWALVGGLVAIMAIFSLVVWLKKGPLLPSESPPVIAWALGGVATASLLMGLLWARPLIPVRPSGTAPAGLWLDPTAGARALLFWVMCEGGTIIATVGTLMTGSYFTAGVALAGLALLLTHSPGYLESRE